MLRFVAQVAGKIQGLLDGDLGDLGAASLTERQVLDILNLGIHDTVKVFEKENMNTAIESRTKRQKLSSQALWRPLETRQQLHLELIARLLACAQRLYMAREGWDALDRPDDTLERFWKIPGPNNDGDWVDPEPPEVEKVSIQVLAECPWMSLILPNIIPSNDCAIPSKPDISGAITPIQNPLYSVLKLLEKEEYSRASPIPYLAIIGACAELFPAGECGF